MAETTETRIAVRLDTASREIIVSEFRGRSTRGPLRVTRVKQPEWWRELNAESMRRFGRSYMDMLNRDEVRQVREAVGRYLLAKEK